MHRLLGLYMEQIHSTKLAGLCQRMPVDVYMRVSTESGEVLDVRVVKSDFCHTLRVTDEYMYAYIGLNGIVCQIGNPRSYGETSEE